MNVRSFVILAAAAAAVAAGLYHWKAIRAQSRMEADRSRVLADATEMRRLYAETSRQVVAARSELQGLIADRMKRPAPAPSTGFSAPSTGATLASPTKSAAIAADPELRRLQVQAFVSDQRLRFAALLKRLGFTPEQVQQFDGIHGAYQQLMLDDAQTEVARQQARQARDAQLRELFGPAFDQWADANRNQPARAIVAQIVQQTFQSSGALTTAQADELTRIVGQHRIPPSKETGPGQTRYDWDQIITDAHSILADRQREDFIAAIEFRRASEKMSAMAAKKKQ